jgi:hypothetical protein
LAKDLIILGTAVEKWKAFWSLPGFTQRVKAKMDFGLHAAANVSGWKSAGIG